MINTQPIIFFQKERNAKEETAPFLALSMLMVLDNWCVLDAKFKQNKPQFIILKCTKVALAT